MKEVEPDKQFDAGDPFSPGNIPIVQNITLLRIYDVLMAILTSMDEDAAEKLFDLHERGGLMTPPPGFDPEEVYASESTPPQEQD